jgi:hypothetical protein
MRLPQQLDPAIRAIFDPEQKPPDYDKWFEEMKKRDQQTDYTWISELELKHQRELLLRHDIAKRRGKNMKTTTWISE